jgi:hypothetical protein
MRLPNSSKNGAPAMLTSVSFTNLIFSNLI